MGTVPQKTCLYFLLVHIIRSHNVKVSKACFGTPGLECTGHELNCVGGKIAMQDAFLSHNSSCGEFGLSSCGGVVVGDLTYTDKRAEFNETLTEELYKNCSLKESCNFDAGRNGTDLNFSVLKYICINETSNFCDEEAIDDNDKSLLWNKTSRMNEGYKCSCRISSNNTEPTVVYALDMRPRSACHNLSITADGHTYKNCNQNIQYQLLANTTLTIILEPVDLFDILWIYIQGHFEMNCSTTITSATTTTAKSPTSTPTPTPTLTSTSTTSTKKTTTTRTPTWAPNAGAIAGGLIGVLVVCVILAALLIWFKFVRNKKKENKPEAKNAFAGSLSSTAIQQNDSRNLKAFSNYDYATVQDGANPVGHAQNHYALVGKPSTNKVTTVLEEDDYNHINHNPPQSDSSPGYDTTVSAAVGVKKLNNASCYSVDDDDYNHLGDGKPSVVSSDYDTTVSASKVVAQLSEMKNSEDDYDHFKKNEDRVIDSPYDTANHHSSVSSDMTPNPYDLEI